MSAPKFRLKFIITAGILILGVYITVPAQTEEKALAIPKDRQDQLLYILHQDCGSCHGLTLKGGLGPTLLPDTMKDRDANDLADVILNGIPGTPMPPWRPFVTQAEAIWLAHALIEGGAAQ